MKGSLISLALLGGLLATNSLADSIQTTEGIYRFNLSCQFPATGCLAQARILLDIRADAEDSVSHPERCGNILEVICSEDGGLIAASGATLFHLESKGFHWRIESASGAASLWLDGHPFDIHSGTVAVQLVSEGRRVDGLCATSVKQTGDR